MDKLQKSSRVDQILDLLLDALVERQQERRKQSGVQPSRARPVQTRVEKLPEPAAKVKPQRREKDAEPAEKIPDTPAPIPPPASMGQMARLLPRMVAGVLLLLILVNIPFNRHGTSLARAMPDSAALIIRDGLILKGKESDEIYVLEDDQLRWISSLEAFERLGYKWQDVHLVAQSFLEKFETGRPMYVLFKCYSSPHIYRIEREQKRWIKDIPTFLAEGHVWEDVRLVSCKYLRDIPDGPSIPLDAGLPPQP